MTIVITPLLALGSNQLDKALAVSDTSITTYHLDDLDTKPKMDSIVITKLEGRQPDQTMILLTFPQCMVGSADVEVYS